MSIDALGNATYVPLRMQLPENRRLTVIAAVGALCCCACAMWVPIPSEENGSRLEAHVPMAQIANASTSAKLGRIQHENRRLRSRLEQATEKKAIPLVDDAAELPAVITVRSEWLRANNSYANPLAPELSSSWFSLFNLTEGEQQQLKDIVEGNLQRIHAFEAAHASTVTDADGGVRIRVEPFNPSGPPFEWHFSDELKNNLANVVGEEKASLISKPLLRTTYSRHTNDAVELSFEMRNEALILVHKTKETEGHGETTFEIPVESKSSEIFTRYGHLLRVDSAEDLRKMFHNIAPDSGSPE